MLEDGKISLKQFALLFIISRLMISMAYLSFYDAPPANQDLWISTLISFFVHIIITIPIYLLVMRFKNLSIIQISEIVLGKIGKIVGLLYIWFYAHTAATTLRQFGEFFTAVPFPETPIIVFVIIAALATAYAVLQGIENIGRFANFTGPIIIFSVLLIFVLLLKDMDFKYIYPVLEKGIGPVLYGAFIIACRTKEILLLGMLYPYLNRPKEIKKTLLVSLFVLAVLFTLIVFSTLVIFGIDEAKFKTFPFYYTVRMISIADFIERIDAVFLAIWVMGMFIRHALSFYLTALGLAQTLSLKNYKSIILPLGALIVSLSIWQAGSMIELNSFLSYRIYTWYSFFYIFVIPLFLLVVAAIRKKGADSR